MTEYKQQLSAIIDVETGLCEDLRKLVIGLAGCFECHVARQRLKELGSTSIQEHEAWEFSATLNLQVEGEQVRFDFEADNGTCDFCSEHIEYDTVCSLDEFAFVVGHRGDFEVLFTKGYAHGLTSLGSGHANHPIDPYPDAEHACGYALRKELGYDEADEGDEADA